MGCQARSCQGPRGQEVPPASVGPSLQRTSSHQPLVRPSPKCILPAAADAKKTPLLVSYAVMIHHTTRRMRTDTLPPLQVEDLPRRATATQTPAVPHHGLPISTAIKRKPSTTHTKPHLDLDQAKESLSIAVVAAAANREASVRGLEAARSTKTPMVPAEAEINMRTGTTPTRGGRSG